MLKTAKTESDTSCKNIQASKAVTVSSSAVSIHLWNIIGVLFKFDVMKLLNIKKG